MPAHPLFIIRITRRVGPDQLVGGSQTLAHDRQQRERGGGVLRHEFEQVVSIEREQFAVDRGDGVGGAGTAVKQRDFPEDTSRPALGHDHLPAVPVLQHDLDAAAAHDVERASAIALPKDPFATAHSDR